MKCGEPLENAIVNEADRKWTTRDCSAQSRGEIERRASHEHSINSRSVRILHICRRLTVVDIGDAWRPNGQSVAPEAHTHRYLHSRLADLRRRRNPARSQIAEHVENCVELLGTVFLVCLAGIRFSRILLSAARYRQLEILAERIDDVWHARVSMKDAAACFVGIARWTAKHAAAKGRPQERVRPELMMGRMMHPSRQPKGPNSRADCEDQRRRNKQDA